MKKQHFLKLRAAVIENGYNLRILAHELNLSQQSLNEKIHGRTDFTLSEIIKTCNFLNSQPEIFFDAELHNLQFLKK